MYPFTGDRSIGHISNLLALAYSTLKIAICATESQHERLDSVMIGDETRRESTPSRTRYIELLLVPARSSSRRYDRRATESQHECLDLMMMIGDET